MELLSHPLTPGTAIGLWQVGATHEARFDLPDQPMAGQMDPFFFLTKDKNFIPHEYPCRTAFAADRRDRRPQVAGVFAPDRVWLPFGSPRLDLSGFWFRPTQIATWAQTVIHSAGGAARLACRTCGGAVLFVNGAEVGWMAPYRRNAETQAEFDVALAPGETVVTVFFDDLAERDARYYLQLDWLDGPAGAVAGVPVPDAGLARAVERTLATMHFDAPAYTGGDVALTLPHPLPVAAQAQIRVEGDFMSHQGLTLTRDLPAQAPRLVIDAAQALPGDFRHFGVTLAVAGFAASRTFGVEICHTERQGPAPAALPDRTAEALAWVAEAAEPDTVAALARLGLGLGDARTAAMIEAALPAIEDCWDCADFALVPLIWGRVQFGHLLPDALCARIDRAMLDYRYWMDEPGNDVQWYFSENHALLFHTAAYLAGTHLPDATFRRSGRSGAEQAAVGRDRVRAWLDHFEAWEMAEFNSAPYFPIDLKGLTALFALAPDTDIRDRAGAAVLRLLRVVARSAHQGVLTAAQGRSYEHTLRAGASLELSAIGRLIWGRGNLGARFHALPGLALAIRDHGLAPDCAALAADALWDRDAEAEWRFAQGEGRFAALYHAKARDWAMGSAAAYRWFDWGYQETVIHARIGDAPQAQVWINQPGEVIHSGYARPSYWGGSASIPRCQQYRGLAVLWFDGQPEQPGFTHAWFPMAAFDETRLDGATALARQGGGVLMLRTGSPLHLMTDGPTTGCELRQDGRQGWWLLRLGAARDLDGFAARMAGLTVTGGPRDDITIADPDYGPVIFHADGRVTAQGRHLAPSDWTVPGTQEVLG